MVRGRSARRFGTANGEFVIRRSPRSTCSSASPARAREPGSLPPSTARSSFGGRLDGSRSPPSPLLAQRCRLRAGLRPCSLCRLPPSRRFQTAGRCRLRTSRPDRGIHPGLQRCSCSQFRRRTRRSQRPRPGQHKVRRSGLRRRRRSTSPCRCRTCRRHNSRLRDRWRSSRPWLRHRILRSPCRRPRRSLHRDLRLRTRRSLRCRFRPRCRTRRHRKRHRRCGSPCSRRWLRLTFRNSRHRRQPRGKGCHSRSHRFLRCRFRSRCRRFRHRRRHCYLH